MSDKTELLPCPFCGGEMELDPGAASFARGPGEVYVTCDCGAMGAGGNTPDEAIAVWNRRATIQPTAAEPVHQGRIHTANGHWSDITEAEAGMWKADGFTVRTLYTGPVAPADAVRDARDLALEEAAKLCDELDNPENSEDYRAGAVWCRNRIRALKSTQKEPAK